MSDQLDRQAGRLRDLEALLAAKKDLGRMDGGNSQTYVQSSIP